MRKILGRLLLVVMFSLGGFSLVTGVISAHAAFALNDWSISWPLLKKCLLGVFCNFFVFFFYMLFFSSEYSYGANDDGHRDYAGERTKKQTRGRHAKPYRGAFKGPVRVAVLRNHEANATPKANKKSGRAIKNYIISHPK